jgi:hypothetical protein
MVVRCHLRACVDAIGNVQPAQVVTVLLSSPPMLDAEPLTQVGEVKHRL